MTIAIGSRLPEATLLTMGENGAEVVTLSDRLKGRKVVIFGLPGAYTGTCSTAHVPSFMRTAGKFADKGVDEILCVSVNDPFVMKAWGEATGATATGITMLGDADASFTKAIGLTFDVPHLGFFARSKRYSLLAEDGVVTQFNPETGPGCEISAGEHLLSQL
jgi:peroxiredoxin